MPSSNSASTVARVAGPATAGSWTRLPAWSRRAIILLVLIGIWQAYASLSGVSPFVFAGPWDVAVAWAAAGPTARWPSPP